jgi:outer membrane receptor protein involved in Fe transport
MTRNVESADFKGAEVEVALQNVADFRIAARGAWISLSTSASEGYVSKYALRPQVERVGISVDRSFVNVLTLGIRGARERRLGESSYMRLDARAALDLAGVRLWMDVTNAADEGYLDVVGNPSPGRALALGLEWRAGD